MWQIRNHLAWGLQRDRSIRVDRLHECSTMGSQRAGDRRKFFDPFRSELRDYLLQAENKSFALVSLFEVASRAHLYKDLVICGSRGTSQQISVTASRKASERDVVRLSVSSFGREVPLFTHQAIPFVESAALRISGPCRFHPPLP